jgi:hypothetical protein
LGNFLFRLFAIAVTASTLVACAAPVQTQWLKEGGSDFQRTDALSECQYQIKLNKTPALQEPELLRMCMQGKGWRLRQVNQLGKPV